MTRPQIRSMIGRSRVERVQCEICSMVYCTTPAELRWHKKWCDKAIAARDSLTGVGPCPLPINFADRDALKDGASLRLAMWAYFTRSLSSAPYWYDLKMHPSWQRYAQTYLANIRHCFIREWHWDHPEVKQLIAEFWAKPDPAMLPGHTYWDWSVEWKHRRINRLIKKGRNIVSLTSI